MKTAIDLFTSGHANEGESLKAMVLRLHSEGNKVYATNGAVLSAFNLSLVTSFSDLNIVVAASNNITAASKSPKATKDKDPVCPFCSKGKLISVKLMSGDGTHCSNCRATDYSNSLKATLLKSNRLTALIKSSPKLKVTM